MNYGEFELKEKKTLLVGVSGAVCASDINNYLFYLHNIFNINVILTENAKRFITKDAISYYVDGIYEDMFGESLKVPHISLAKSTDVFLILPATANVIGKIAHGICDDLLTTSAMAYNKSIVFCPSMNPLMWHSSILQDNINYLKEKGHVFLNRKGKTLEVENLKMVETDCAVLPPLDLCKRLYEMAY